MTLFQPPFPSRDPEETRLSGLCALARMLIVTALVSGVAGLGPVAMASATDGRKREILLEDDSPQRIERLERNLSAALRYIEQIQHELEEIKYGGPLPPRPVPAIARGDDVRGPVRQVQTAPPPRTPVDEEQERVSGDQEAPRLQAAALRRARAVLIGAGNLEIEPGLGFSFTDRNRLDVRGLDVVENVFIGNIEVRSVQRDSLTSFLSFRYGLLDRVQLSMAVPYLYSRDRAFLPPAVQRQDDLGEDVENSSSSHDVGDVTLGVSVHGLQERPWLPDVILNAELKTDTGSSPFEINVDESASGTGFWGLSLGATAVKVTDPAVLFANAGYFFHFEEDDVGVFDKVDPPDSFSLGFGFSYSLNPFLSFTTRFSGRRVEKTKLNGQEIDGSDQVSSSINLGISYGLGGGRAVDVTAGFGLTPDSPDFSLSLSIPFRFHVGSPDWLSRQWTWW